MISKAAVQSLKKRNTRNQRKPILLKPQGEIVRIDGQKDREIEKVRVRIRKEGSDRGKGNGR